jgi:hypothetical protein
MKASSLISTNIFPLFQILKAKRGPTQKMFRVSCDPRLREMANIKR